MGELSVSKSIEQASVIKDLQTKILELDIDYLKRCLNEMQNSLSYRQAALILDPRPATVFQRHSLESSKLKQLELYIEIAENAQAIIQGESSVIKANQVESILTQLLG